MANTSKCETCQHYDPLLRGMRETPRGWCVKRSLYPYHDSPGQITPAHAVRVTDPDAPAKPRIVTGAEVIATCTTYQPRKNKQSKAELMAKALGKGS